MRNIRKSLIVAVAASALSFGASCGEDAPVHDPAEPEPASSVAHAVDEEGGSAVLTVPSALTDFDEFNTYIDEYIEIDELNGGPGDANLHSLAEAPGGDPADGTDHALLPAGGTTYVDWNHFAGSMADHQFVDQFKSDDSSFPQKNECVGHSQVLSKMDLTAAAAANNSEYAYFSVQRRNNNGDAGWMMIFTKLPPQLNQGEAPCKADQSRLLYDITGPTATTTGDVLLVGHFKPNDSPLVRVFHATTDAADVPAGAAIDFESALWVEQSPEGLAAAVNTSITDPGAFGSAGVDALDSNGHLQPEIFTETAVPISIFTSGSVCGARYYGTVITRPSGAGGTSPDLKDLLGPGVINFGSAEAQAEIKATCGLQLYYNVTEVLGVTGEAADPADYTCSWTFYDDDTDTELAAHPTDCEGVVDVPAAGNYRAEVQVDLTNALQCSDTVALAAIPVYDPLVATASAAATCEAADNPAYDSKIEYYGTATGGSGDLDIAWSFYADSCPGCATTPTSSTQLHSAATPGTFDVLPAAEEYTAKLVVTDNRTDAVDANGDPDICDDDDDAQATPYAPLTVSLTLQASPQLCPAEAGDPDMTSDAVTYVANYSGGDGNYTFDWTIDACDGSDTCTIDPSDSDFCPDVQVQLYLDDGTEICSGLNSEIETYTKRTLITASDN